MFFYYDDHGKIISATEQKTDFFRFCHMIELEVSDEVLQNITSYKMINNQLVIDNSLAEIAAQKQEQSVLLHTQFLQKDKVRKEIYAQAGDTAALLGTTADGVHLLLFAFSQMTVALNKANSLAEVREAAAPFNDLATAFLGKVKSGEVKLPFQAKGLESVVADIETRATAVTEVLASNG